MARPLSAIVNHLLRSHGPQLGAPAMLDGQPLGPLIDHIHKAMSGSLSKRHIRSVLDGKYDNDLRYPTAEAWARFLRRVHPAIEATWFFATTLDDFLARLKAAPVDASASSVAIDYPRYRELTDELRGEYAGATYICYRYPFEGFDSAAVAREVLHIRSAGESLEFVMSFWPGASQGRQSAHTYNGIVFPAGRSLFLVGFNISQAAHDRGRSLFFDDALGDSQLRNCKFGILSTTRLHGDLAPCAACTVLVRVQWEPEDLAEFLEEVTTIDEFDKIIGADFGIRDDEASRRRLSFLRLFMDNRPSGTPRGPELAGIEGNRTVPEPVLRLNTNRFNAEMPHILRSALADEAVYAPFKANWPSRPPGG
jgi:hypothetical protein